VKFDVSKGVAHSTMMVRTGMITFQVVMALFTWMSRRTP
jgi:hypothetical protein